MIELKILLNWASCAFLLSSGLLFMRRHCGDRSRLYLALTWLVFGLVFLLRLFVAEFGEPIVNRVSDMINRKRVAEFLKLADAGLVVNIQDSFFYVGFRSRETALRCFKKYVGMSPTDYLRFRMTSH